MEEIKVRAKCIHKMDKDISKIYNYTISKLIRKSIDEFKNHEDCDIFKRHLSLKGLWVVLREIHSLNSSSTNSLINKIEAFQQYAGIK